VLLHEFVQDAENQPDGSYIWELLLLVRVCQLWSTRVDEHGSVVSESREELWEFGKDPAPGWRMLSSLPSCSNHHWHMPMHPVLREEQQRRVA